MDLFGGLPLEHVTITDPDSPGTALNDNLSGSEKSLWFLLLHQTFRLLPGNFRLDYLLCTF